MTPMYEIRRLGELIAEAETWNAAERAATILAEEMKVPRRDLVVLHPPDALVPIKGFVTTVTRPTRPPQPWSLIEARRVPGLPLTHTED